MPFRHTYSVERRRGPCWRAAWILVLLLHSTVASNGSSGATVAAAQVRGSALSSASTHATWLELDASGSAAGTTCTAGWCHNQGTCAFNATAMPGSRQTCDCNQYFSGAQCTVPFDDSVPTLYLAWWISTAVVFGSIAVLQAWLVLRVFGCLGARPQPVTARDSCLILNQLAVCVRLVWLVDPKGLRGTLSPAAEGILLRVPEVLWFSAVFAMLLMYDSIVKATQEKKVSACQKATVISLVAFLAMVSIAASVLGTLPGLSGGGSQVNLWLDVAQNGIMALYGVGLMIAGFVYAFRLLATLASFGMDTAAFQVVRRVRNTIIMCLVVDIVLIGAVATREALNLVASRQPVAYMVFLYVVHIGCEGGVAALVLYANAGARPFRESTARRALQRSMQHSHQHASSLRQALLHSSPSAELAMSRDGTGGADALADVTASTAGGTSIGASELGDDTAERSHGYNFDASESDGGDDTLDSSVYA